MTTYRDSITDKKLFITIIVFIIVISLSLTLIHVLFEVHLHQKKNLHEFNNETENDIQEIAFDKK